MTPRPKWRFRVECDELPDGRYRVVLTTDSGQRFERTGVNPLWELIRIVGQQQQSKED